MTNKPAICKYCVHRSVVHDICTAIHTDSRVSPVTGKIVQLPCDTWNWTGDCPHYKEDLSWFFRLLKRLGVKKK